jgi:hypothetical protein
MVGERGFEPPTHCSRTNNRFTNPLSRLDLFCVLYNHFPRYQEASGPKLDPSLGLKNNCNGAISVQGGFFKVQCLGRALVIRLAPHNLVTASKQGRLYGTGPYQTSAS